MWHDDGMPRLLLIRHAAATGHDADDPGLSAQGRLQAEQLADALATLDVRAVWHGPKRRTEQTARAVESRIGCERLTTELLDDRTPFPADDRWEEYPRHRWEWFEQVPADERDTGGAALSAAWTNIRSQLDTSGTLVAVTHAFVVAWFVSLAMNAPPPSWTHLAVSNAAITEIEQRANGDLIIHRFNDTGHLQS